MRHSLITCIGVLALIFQGVECEKDALDSDASKGVGLDTAFHPHIEISQAMLHSSSMGRKLQQLAYYYPAEGTTNIVQLINSLYPGLNLSGPVPPPPPFSPPPPANTALVGNSPTVVTVNPYPPPGPAPPTLAPTPTPTSSPTQAATPLPTQSVTPTPTQSPTPNPTLSPTPNPTESPTPSPTPSPTTEPTPAPTTLTPTPTTLTPAPTPSLPPPTSPVSAPATETGGLQLASLPPAGSPCKKINDFLDQSPSLQTWNKLLQSSGYTNNLANPNVDITMFAPINSAFTVPVLANTNYGRSVGSNDVSTLVASQPSSVNPLIGYHFFYGVTKSAQLTPGSTFNTTDTIKTFGSPDKFAQVTIPSANQIQGIGSSATILKADLEVCGPSVVHVIDAVLLPVPLNSSPAPGSATGR